MEGLIMRLQLWKAKIADLEESMKHFESSLKDVSKWNTAKQEYLQDNMEDAKELKVENFQVIKVLEIHINFNCKEVYNPSPMDVKGFNDIQQVYRPQLMVIGHATNPSWNLGNPADIIESVCKWSEDYWGNRISPQPRFTFDRGKVHALYCTIYEYIGHMD